MLTSDKEARRKREYGGEEEASRRNACGGEARRRRGAEGARTLMRPATEASSRDGSEPRLDAMPMHLQDWLDFAYFSGQFGEAECAGGRLFRATGARAELCPRGCQANDQSNGASRPYLNSVNEHV